MSPKSTIALLFLMREVYHPFAMKCLLARSLLAASLILFSVVSYGQASTGSDTTPAPSVVLSVDAEQDVTILSATTTSGTIKHGGILNGTTSDQFTGTPMATGDPNTIAFTDVLTITTDRGTLINNDVTIFDPLLRVFSTISKISSGTGIFKGATGTLFISGSSTDGVHYEDRIIGEIHLVLEK
jgi:hypothetical protein